MSSSEISDSIGNFSELVAAGTPAPGGGSVAAHAGLLAASLGQMMCNLTVGKKKYEQVEPRVREIKAELERLGSRLRELISEDAASFEEVLKAYRMPKETEEEKAARARQIERAARGSVNTPYETARHSFDVLKLLGELRKIGNSNALPDVSVGSQLALVAVKGAYYNIGVNLSMLADEEAAPFGERITKLVEESKAMAAEAESDMLARM